MTLGTLRILFFEKGMALENRCVAEIQVDELSSAVNAPVQVVRVDSPAKPFDRVILHLDDGPLESFVNEASTTSFLGLRLTTLRPGVPASKPHIMKRDPLRLVLAVRRMEALREPDVWNAFLRASEEDCLAVYKGHPSAVRDEAKPMLRLFVEQERAMPALRILCLAFEEIHRRADAGIERWKAKAIESQRAEWWRQAIDHVTVTLRKNGSNYESAWGDARRVSADDATAALLQRMSIEAMQWRDESAGKIRLLVSALANDSEITRELVHNAEQELSALTV